LGYTTLCLIDNYTLKEGDEMLINKTIDTINKFIVAENSNSYPDLVSEYLRVKGMINSSIKFSFLNGEFEGLLSNNDYFKLPYTHCYFETSSQGKGVYGLLLEQINDDTIICNIIQDSKIGFEPQLLEFEAFHMKDDVMLRVRNTVESHELYGYNEAKVLAEMCFAFVGAACRMMNCSNVELVNNIPSKLKQSRIKKGKSPLFEFKTLHIKQNTKKNIQQGNGTHKSPRVHLRRGHIRRLPTGTTTWVQPCMVGSADGIVHKDYTVH